MKIRFFTKATPQKKPQHYCTTAKKMGGFKAFYNFNDNGHYPITHTPQYSRTTTFTRFTKLPRKNLKNPAKITAQTILICHTTDGYPPRQSGTGTDAGAANTSAQIRASEAQSLRVDAVRGTAPKQTAYARTTGTTDTANIQNFFVSL